MSKLTIPNGFEAPFKVSRSRYTLEALAPKHNELDYDAWASSKENLQGIFGPDNDWPNDGTSLEKNRSDLENHYNEFVEKIAYAYSVLNPDESLCLGCLYIRPTPAPQFDTRVDFWFRSSSRDLEKEFHSDVDKWLKRDWGFKSIAYPGRNISWDEYTYPIRS